MVGQRVARHALGRERDVNIGCHHLAEHQRETNFPALHRF